MKQRFGQEKAMVLYIIGLGLADEKDITIKWVALQGWVLKSIEND